MSMRIHTMPKYQVEYGSTISRELTEQVIDVFQDAESGWVTENENGSDGEISREELQDIIKEMDACPLRDALVTLESESDPENDFVRFCEF